MKENEKYMTFFSSLIKKSGRLFDIWSVPHFLFGVVAAMMTIVYAWPFWETFFAILLLAVLWEGFEMRMRIAEYFWNMLTDVSLPLVAYGAVIFLVDHAGIDQEHRVALLVISILVYVFTNVFAWRARLFGDQDFYN